LDARSPLARQFIEPPPAPPAGELDSYEATPHQHAASGKRRALRFRIVLADGKRYGFQFAHLVTWLLDGEELTLYMTTHQITIAGQNLDALELLLPEDKLTEVREFRPGVDGEPPANAPKVERIRVEPLFRTN
jgi:hypothetical protein